jgi:cytochrome c5
LSHDDQHVDHHDDRFFDTFLLVIGGLIAIAVVIFIFARSVGGSTQIEVNTADARIQNTIAGRIKPVGRVLEMGGAELEAAAAAAAAAAAPAARAEPLTGPEVYAGACVACHAPPGVGGAPPLGDKAQWGPRIAQGIETLYMHALNGFQGTKGIMPAKGGRPDLSDDEIKAGVDHLVAQGR